MVTSLKMLACVVLSIGGCNQLKTNSFPYFELLPLPLAREDDAYSLDKINQQILNLILLA